MPCASNFSEADIVAVSVDATSGNLSIEFTGISSVADLDGTDDTIQILDGFVTKAGAAQVPGMVTAMPITSHSHSILPKL